MIRAFWFNIQNFGDSLNPWLIKKITGEDVCFVDSSEADCDKFMLVGSILAHAKNRCIVWGCGLGSLQEDVKPEAAIHMVRGPISAKKCPHLVFAQGDPALLVPYYYHPRGNRNIYRLGVIPHYVDQERFFDLFSGHDVKFINICDSVEQVVEDVWSCSHILSSSLHGLIIADALHKPTRWVKFTNKLSGDGSKFLDYQLQSGAPQTMVDLSTEGVNTTENMTVNGLIAACEDRQVVVPVNSMMSACPLPIRNRPQY